MSADRWVMVAIAAVLLGPMVVAFLVWWFRLFWELVKMAWNA